MKAHSRMPTVIVVLETNFAYGAATPATIFERCLGGVYMQLLYFLDQRKARMPTMEHVRIVFATPVSRGRRRSCPP